MGHKESKNLQTLINNSSMRTAKAIWGKKWYLFI